MKLSTLILWGLVLVYAVVGLVTTAFPRLSDIPFALFALLAFAIIHGVVGYRLSGVVVFFISGLVVSNIIENVSILTGFPFGHYHYTDLLGPKLFLVPILIGPAYCAVGYLSWVLSTVLVGAVRRESRVLTIFAVPFIASFMMVMWDLCFDPIYSTIDQRWIWEQGGGYFGVPLTNYLGWFLTVYIFFQIFALYLWRRGSRNVETPPLSRGYYFQAVIVYATIGLTFIAGYLTSGNTQVTDAIGTIWHTGNIYESSVIVSIYTMIFIAALSALKLVQGRDAALV